MAHPDGSKRATAAPLRWVGAAISIMYGFAKLNESQFTVLDSELAKPLGEVSGFWLTWHYFGYSPPYGTLIALLQIGGGILLVWPRTALVGALLLFPVFTNIALVDVFFGIDLGATLVALAVLGCLGAVIAPHVERLRAAVLLDSSSDHKPVRLAFLGLVLIGAWSFTWWIANFNNRRPTPIDGVWAVVSETANDAASPRWQRAFFERNRAHLVVFRASDGTDERHHFEVDENGVVRVWETWLRKGPLIMQGSTRDDRLELEMLGGTRRGQVLLRRENPRSNPPVAADR